MLNILQVKHWLLKITQLEYWLPVLSDICYWNLTDITCGNVTLQLIDIWLILYKHIIKNLYCVHYFENIISVMHCGACTVFIDKSRRLQTMTIVYEIDWTQICSMYLYNLKIGKAITTQTKRRMQCGRPEKTNFIALL